MTRKPTSHLHIDELAERIVPATWNISSVGGNLTIQQLTPATGILNITDDGTTVTLMDGASNVSVPSLGVANTSYKLLPSDTGDVVFRKQDFVPETSQLT